MIHTNYSIRLPNVKPSYTLVDAKTGTCNGIPINSSLLYLIRNECVTSVQPILLQVIATVIPTDNNLCRIDPNNVHVVPIKINRIRSPHSAFEASTPSLLLQSPWPFFFAFVTLLTSDSYLPGALAELVH